MLCKYDSVGKKKNKKTPKIFAYIHMYIQKPVSIYNTIRTSKL